MVVVVAVDVSLLLLMDWCGARRDTRVSKSNGSPLKGSIYVCVSLSVCFRTTKTVTRVEKTTTIRALVSGTLLTNTTISDISSPSLHRG